MTSEKRFWLPVGLHKKLFFGVSSILLVGLLFAMLPGGVADAGHEEFRQITVFTFVDANGNGVRDGADEWLSDVWVDAQKPGKDYDATSNGASTDDGLVEFELFETGMYRVRLRQVPEGYVLNSITCQDAAQQPLWPCHGDVERAELKVLVGKGENPILSFGFVPEG